MEWTGLQRRSAKLLAVAVLAGCGSPSTNMRIGGVQSYESLKAQREAALSVVEVPAVPEGATAVAPVDASRCHRYQGDIEPTQEQLIEDLKAAAYARGADGIAAVQITRESGILRNCWHIITARGMMFRTAARKP